MGAYVDKDGVLMDSRLNHVLSDEEITGLDVTCYDNRNGELDDIIIFINKDCQSTVGELYRILKNDVVIIPDLSRN